MSLGTILLIILLLMLFQAGHTVKAEAMALAVGWG